MNYAWEAALAADHDSVAREQLRFVAASTGSPYTEIVQETLNREHVDDPVVELNPLYRFAEEFSCIFDINLKEYKQTRELLFDSVMHYMVQLDLRQGLSKQEYDLRFLLRDILDEVCGAEAARVIRCFEDGQLRKILRLILKLYQCGSSIYLFREVMRCLYPDSLVYASNEAIRQVLIYVGVKKNTEEQEKLDFLTDMFLPVNYDIYLFWENHFGIVDVEETMVLDEMVLF